MNEGSTEKGKQARVYLALGSNLGERERYLDAGISMLAVEPNIRILRTSSRLENPPLFVEEQPDFLNQIVEIETTIEPIVLLRLLKKMEIVVGRKESFRNGPREIDIDILVYSNRKMNTDELTIPHPGLLARPFLRTLLAELGETPESLDVLAGQGYIEARFDI